jgi:hypothetical protein
MLKIVPKTKANRIKHVLNDIISPQQSAFLPGRLITDNTLIAYEAFRYLKQAKNRKHGYVGIKLDMAKAWCFLENTLTNMGFPTRLINIIILGNGTPSHSFSPQRGIRQGDPLSSYLFIIYVDVLYSFITQLQQNN